MKAAYALSFVPMVANLRDALTSLDAKNAPPQSALQDLPGERLLLDMTRLGLRSVFGGDLQGRATFVLHEDDSGYFETPDELSQIGMIRGEDISEHLSFQDVTADLHETLRERLEAESAALEALDLDVILEAPLAQAQGITFIGRHRVSIGASIDGGLWLLTLDEVPVPEELAALGLHMQSTSAEELWQTLQGALKNQDLINLSLPPQDADSQSEIVQSEPRSVSVPDDESSARGMPPAEPLGSRHNEFSQGVGEMDWDEDEAPTSAIPALSLPLQKNVVEHSAVLDGEPDVVEPFDFDVAPPNDFAASSDSVETQAVPGLSESVPPEPPPAAAELDLDLEEGAEQVPTNLSLSPELSMPDVGELEFPASAVDMPPEPEQQPAPASLRAERAPLNEALADAEAAPELAPANTTADVSAPVVSSPVTPMGGDPVAAPQGQTHLAAVVGDGIASGKTGAIELNADAFAALGREDLDMAESLEREATILEARVLELRANAKRLRERHANLAELFGLRNGGGGAPELSISEWASGELPSDLSEVDEQAPASSAEKNALAKPDLPNGVADEGGTSDAFAAADSVAKNEAPYPEMMAPDEGQATQMVEMRASAFESLRKQTPQAISNMESASASSAGAASDADENTHAVMRPDLGGSLSYERAVDDALDNLGTGSAANAAELSPAAEPAPSMKDEEPAPSTRQQDAELEAAFSQDFDSESQTGVAPLVEPEAASSPDPSSGVQEAHAEPEPQAATAPRPQRVALVVDDARARSRLQKYLQAALGEMDEAATVADARAQLDLTQVGYLVAVRPKADEETFSALASLANEKNSPAVLILSADARFDGVAGVGLRLELARRASEVADQVVQGLNQLGIVAHEV